MDNVLYFPYISIPRSRWLMQTLLYWDRIGTVVPSDYIYHPRKLGKHMQILVKEQLVDQIFPAAYIEDTRKMHNSFLAHVDSKLEERPLKCIYREQRRASFEVQETVDPANYVKIHMEKLDGLAEELIDRGLAKRADGPWYWVQKEIGYDFMAFLVSVIGHNARYSPITNDAIYLSNYLDSPGYRPEKVKNESIRYRLLKAILPIPANEIDVDALVDFKQKHSVQLTNFRNLIERCISDISYCNEEQHEDKINDFKSEIEEQQNEIKTKMAENQWFISLSNFVSVGSTLGGIGIGLATGNELGTVIRAPRLISAIYNAVSRNDLDDYKDHPVAYSLYVGQEKEELFRRRTRLKD